MSVISCGRPLPGPTFPSCLPVQRFSVLTGTPSFALVSPSNLPGRGQVLRFLIIPERRDRLRPHDAVHRAPIEHLVLQGLLHPHHLGVRALRHFGRAGGARDLP